MFLSTCPRHADRGPGGASPAGLWVPGLGLVRSIVALVDLKRDRHHAWWVGRAGPGCVSGVHRVGAHSHSSGLSRVEISRRGVGLHILPTACPPRRRFTSPPTSAELSTWTRDLFSFLYIPVLASFGTRHFGYHIRSLPSVHLLRSSPGTRPTHAPPSRRRLC